MNKHRQAVMRKHPKAFCHMSHLSGMYFVHDQPGGRRHLLAYETNANKAWRQANIAPRK